MKKKNHTVRKVNNQHNYYNDVQHVSRLAFNVYVITRDRNYMLSMQNKMKKNAPTNNMHKDFQNMHNMQYMHYMLL